MKTFLQIFFMSFLLYSCKSVKTNGIYKSGEIDDYNHYVRFYNNDTVVTVSSTGTPKDLREWFNKENEGLSKGLYYFKKDSLFFDSKSKAGIVSYRGRIKGNTMILISKSKINGHISTKAYEFFPFD